MPTVTEKHIEQTVTELRKIYQQTGEHLKTQVLSADLSDFQKFRANELLKQIEAEIAALNAVAYKYSKDGIPKSYQRGMDIAGAQLSELDIPHSLNIGNVIHRSSVQAIADQMALDLIQANGTIETGLKQYIRKTQQTAVTERLINRKISQGLIAGEARRQTSDRLAQELKKNIAEGALVKAGSRNYAPETYAELVARTRTREAVTQGAINSGVEYDIELFQVSVHEGACPVCLQYQGRVYSITGNNPDFPRLNQKPPYHPHCRHVLAPVTEGFLKRRGIYQALSDLSNDPNADASSNEAYKAYVKAKAVAVPAPTPAPAPPLPPPSPPPPVPAAVRAVDMIARGLTGAEEFGSRLKLVPNKKLGGSTGARLFVDDEGAKWVVKTYGGRAEQAKNEFLANQIYALNKIGVVESRLARVDGQLGVALRFIDDPGAKIIGQSGAEAAAQLEAVRKGFVVDALVANWDVAGLDFDNIMLVPGKSSKVWRLDQGGSLLFRAQGIPKGAAFGDLVAELSTLRDASINPNTAKLFAGIEDKKLLGYYRQLLTYTKPGSLDQLIEEAGFTGAQAAELKRVLLARLNYIRKMRQQLATKVMRAEKVAEAAKSAPVGGVSVPGQRRTLPRSKSTPDTKALKDLVPAASSIPPNQLRDLQSFTSSSYVSMNKAALKGRGRTNLDNILANESLPGLQGFTHRKVSNIAGRDGKLDKFRSGEWAYVEWKAYSSSAIKPGGTYGNHYGGWNYIVKNHGLQGGYVDPISSHVGELEMLYGRNAKFRVIGWDYGKNYDGSKATGHYVFLEEVAGDIPDSQEPPIHVNSTRFMQEWDKRWEAGLSADDLDPRDFAR